MLRTGFAVQDLEACDVAARAVRDGAVATDDQSFVTAGLPGRRIDPRALRSVVRRRAVIGNVRRAKRRGALRIEVVAIFPNVAGVPAEEDRARAVRGESPLVGTERLRVLEGRLPI